MGQSPSRRGSKLRRVLFRTSRARCPALLSTEVEFERGGGERQRSGQREDYRPNAEGGPSLRSLSLSFSLRPNPSIGAVKLNFRVARLQLFAAPSFKFAAPFPFALPPDTTGVSPIPPPPLPPNESEGVKCGGDGAAGSGLERDWGNAEE